MAIRSLIESAICDHPNPEGGIKSSEQYQQNEHVRWCDVPDITDQPKWIHRDGSGVGISHGIETVMAVSMHCHLKAGCHVNCSTERNFRRPQDFFTRDIHIIAHGGRLDSRKSIPFPLNRSSRLCRRACAVATPLPSGCLRQAMMIRLVPPQPTLPV